jgi:hypothetical protein
MYKDIKKKAKVVKRNLYTSSIKINNEKSVQINIILP